MKRKMERPATAIIVGIGVVLALPFPLQSDEPIIPPTVSRVWPAGLERGTKKPITVEGRNLTGARAVLFDAPGLTARILSVTELFEPPKQVRPGVDLGAAVPEGKKTEAKIEVTTSQDVKPGIHWFRLQTALGTSNTAVLDVGSLPEVDQKRPVDSSSGPQWVNLPATLVGAVATPGEVNTYQFEGRAGEELVFQVEASRLGSELKSLLVLRDASGQVMARAGEYSREADTVLTAKLPADGKYAISVSDRENGGGMDHFYRLNAGPLPYITSVFPLGVRAGQAADIAVQGVNLGDIRQVKAEPPNWADGWTTIPLRVKTARGESLNKVELVVGNEPEVLEKAPNKTPAEAQQVSIPVTINGRIASGEKQRPDEDYFRFRARKGEQLTIEVAAARLSSSLDSLVEVLDEQGRSIPRATVRCLNQTSTTLADRDSESESFRLLSLSGIHENDYLMIGDELVQVAFVPDQPDADIVVRGIQGERLSLLGTSAEVHPVDTPVYKAEIREPGVEFPPNGLPVFHLTYRNDDGGPGYGADSRLEFTAPDDGEYLVHLKDVRGLEGSDFAYRLTIRDKSLDYMLMANPSNPNVPRGGSVPVVVSANRVQGYEGPMELEVKGLPKGLRASKTTIPASQDSAVIILSASADAPLDSEAAPIKILGHATVNGRDLVRVANDGAPLQVAAIIPPPDVVVAAEPREIVLEPGKEATVTLRIERKNGFQGRVPCSVMNLPPGIRVVNVGLNGVLVHETENTQTFTLKAEDWAQPIHQPIYVVAEVESVSPTRHASAPLLLKVEGKKEMASTGEPAPRDHGSGAAEGQRPRNR